LPGTWNEPVRRGSPCVHNAAATAPAPRPTRRSGGRLGSVPAEDPGARQPPEHLGELV